MPGGSTTIHPVENFDFNTDMDLTGGDWWYARPQLFFYCTVCPTGSEWLSGSPKPAQGTSAGCQHFDPVAVTLSECYHAAHRSADVL